MSDLTDEDDGIHPLDRDYEKPVPSPPKRFIFTKSRGLNLGIVGFGVGGFILLIGIVLSQFGEGSQSFEAMAGNAHRLGMWSILFGGGCIIFTMQARVDKPRRRRRRRKRNTDIVCCSIIAKPQNSQIGIRDWVCALSEFDHLVVSQLTADCLRPELEDVYLYGDGRALAVLSWNPAQQGVIRVRLRRRDLPQLKQRCWKLLEFLGADLVDDSTGEHY